MTSSTSAGATPLRLAMWTGPRNISTAMMRAWGNRDDTFVCDEPLYAHYLQHTGVEHPLRDEIVAHHEADWRKVVDWLTGPVPQGRQIFYQKHMTHHLLGHIDRGWLAKLSHCFLIRDPASVINSYIRKTFDPTPQDLGYPQQREIFAWLRERGENPPVIDTRDFLAGPRRYLGMLCDVLHVPFSDNMLSWPPGLRPTDGIWARHWYTEVETSTGFRPLRQSQTPVPAHLRPVYESCLQDYHELYRFRMC